VLLREGKDVAIVSCGIMVAAAITAADLLAKEGIDAAVLNIHTMKPLDTESIVKVAKNTGALVTAEEHSVIGGLGSAVAEVLAENHPVPLKRVGIMDMFGVSGKPDELLEHYGLTPDGIVRAVREVLSRKKAV